MTRLSHRNAMSVLAIALLVTAFQSSPSASHWWGGYHWARTATTFTVKLGDNVNSLWDTPLANASFDWSNSAVLDTLVVSGSANPRNCRPTAGQDQICNGSYSNTGWLGIATIWISGSHITQGTVKLNDTYFNTPTYNTLAWRQFVVCQEVGHTFGLAHQDEMFGNPNLGSCMDYTNDPDGSMSKQANNTHPNQHDYDELAFIYAHFDSTSTVSSSPAHRGANLDNPSEWGQLMHTTRGGRAQTFERDFGNGERIVTFVIWA